MAGALAVHQAAGRQRAGRHPEAARVAVRGARARQERHAGATRPRRLLPAQEDLPDAEGAQRDRVAAAEDARRDEQAHQGDTDAGGRAAGQDRRPEVGGDQTGEPVVQVRKR